MKRFKFAFEGLMQMFKKDSHFLIHIIISLVVAAAGISFQISTIEWLFIVSAVFMVFTTEAVNTSIEYVVDLVTKEYHDYAKFAKDISAFAVLLTSIYAVCIGLIIFLPKLFNLL